MDSQRYLRCLGQPALFTANGEPIRFRTRKHLALLVYIALEERAHRRDRLAELLWPRGSSAEARHSLATALTVLRPRLGLDALETSRDQVRLVPGRLALDLERLRTGDVLGTEVTGPLQVAAFLDGFDINDSAEFTHWKDRQQARLLPVIKDALLVLIDRCRRTGDTRQIEQLADRMLALDDLSEEAIRAKMEARAFAGDRLTALEIFEAWKKKLAEELQAAPSDLVEGMAIRLRRRGWERTILTNIPNVPTDQWRGRPFIGRTAEYRVLYELWEGVQRGVPAHALILGDSGVGKTTLVQRLTTAAGLEGAAISRVQCYDVEREIPYSTITGLILGLLDRPGISGTSPEGLAELSRMVPRVRQRFPNLPNPQEAQGETARIRLTEAFLEMLTVIAEEHAVILVVDDLHLADDVSLAVLHLIMRRARGQQVMVVLVARPGELVDSPQAVRLRKNATDAGLTQIDVQPLSDSESREMLTSLITADEPQLGVVEQRTLLCAAAGFPMVLELLVQEWKIRGEQSLALALDAMTTELGSSGSTQASYSNIMNHITRSLDSTTHNVVNLASILGNRLNDLAMYALVDLTVGQTMTAMAKLVDRRVLRDGPQGLEFVNELIRVAAYVAVPTSLRRVLHGQIADRFIRDQLNGNDNLGLAIAWHCLRAGRTKEATDYLLCGARESMQKGGVHEAERALASALAHLDTARKLEATLLLVEVLHEQGRWHESLALLYDLRIAGDYPLVRVLAIMAECKSMYLSPEETRSRLAQLREVIEMSSNVSIRVKAANVVSILLSHIRDSQAAKDLLLCIDDIPVAPLNLDDLASLANSKAKMMYTASERPPGLRQVVEVAAQLRAKGHLNTTMGNLHVGIGAVACCEGRYEDAKIDFLTAHDIYSSLGNESSRAHQAAQLGLCCFRLGDYEQAIQWSLSALPSCEAQFRGYMECQAALSSGASYALLGQPQSALRAINQLDLRLSRSSPLWIKQAWGLHKADILVLAGELPEALAVAREAIGPGGSTLYSAFFAGPFARWMALTTTDTDQEERARARLTMMLDQLETYDALDQAEILCARRLLSQVPQTTKDELSMLIKLKLARLPSAIADQLTRLGVFPKRELTAVLSGPGKPEGMYSVQDARLGVRWPFNNTPGPDIAAP
jgi:DNA-binding SARP family transcriptional activator/tetratricopeptide (TPR) repeat protein